jgi:hypothetical protein
LNGQQHAPEHASWDQHELRHAVRVAGMASP